ncbi:uncharacterized protein LOC109615191 [Esox lucius]|uniref:uncharacterized protein LOC109615191 n=1 Tax=Esox lucius TaxID=8010 RepID=UPI001477727C|nr:uncharacterized protein LOC109615191 [Esox lucius]
MEQQNLQCEPIAEDCINPDVDPILESSLNKVWTLYHLAQEKDSANTEHAGPGDVLLERRTSHHSDDSSQLCGQTQEESGKKTKSQKYDTPVPHQMKFPNYLLVECSPQTSDYSQESKEANQDSCTGLLSISMPIDSFCGVELSCGPQFLEVTSNEGGVVYSPALQTINPSKPCEDEDAKMTETHQTTSPSKMKWSLKISLKAQTEGGEAPHGK